MSPDLARLFEEFAQLLNLLALLLNEGTQLLFAFVRSAHAGGCQQ